MKMLNLHTGEIESIGSVDRSTDAKNILRKKNKKKKIYIWMVFTFLTFIKKSKFLTVNF